MRQLTEFITIAAADVRLKERTGVLLTEAVEGGCLWRHADKNEELVKTAFGDPKLRG